MVKILLHFSDITSFNYGSIIYSGITVIARIEPSLKKPPTLLSLPVSLITPFLKVSHGGGL